MTVRVNKSAFNIREKLSELAVKFGLKGTELARAETVQDARDLVSAGRKNIVINGDMRIDQRGLGTVSGTAVFGVDRFKLDFANGSNTTQRYALSSADGPPTEKFNYALRLTSGGDLTTSSSYVQVTYGIEHTDIFNSGWNYNYTGSGSTNNNLTVSFWVRSSVSSDVNWMFLTHKATAQVFRPEATRLTAGVWKKVIAKIPPNSNINFDNTTDLGASIYLFPHVGSSFTSTPTNLNGWEAWSGSKYGITNSTWGGSSGATFDLTGVQIEVSDNATEFERRTTGEELALCQRYYEKIQPSNRVQGKMHTGTQAHFSLPFKVTKRTIPTVVSAECAYSSMWDGTSTYNSSVTFGDDGIGAYDVTFRLTLSSTYSGADYRNIGGYGLVCAITAEL